MRIRLRTAIPSSPAARSRPPTNESWLRSGRGRPLQSDDPSTFSFRIDVSEATMADNIIFILILSGGNWHAGNCTGHRCNPDRVRAPRVRGQLTRFRPIDQGDAAAV